MNVRVKEGSGQGWLVETRVIYCFSWLNLNRCALCASSVHQLSRLRRYINSLGCLSVHSLCSFWLSLSPPTMRPSLHSVSPWTPVPRWLFSGHSTPITVIRHRCSSFCTWPTYLPLSPESFSRCRLCNARYQRVIRASVSFMRWSHCKGAWSEQRVNSHPRR